MESHSEQTGTSLNSDENNAYTLAHSAIHGVPEPLREAMRTTLRARLVQGVEVYGHLDLATDERDLAAEARDEAADGVNYCAMLELQLRDRGGDVGRVQEARDCFVRAYELLSGYGALPDEVDQLVAENNAWFVED